MNKKRASLQYNTNTNNNYLRRCSVPLMNVNTIKMNFTKLYDDKNVNLENENEKEEHYEYYRILEIQKNEHFGDILMFLNKRTPLRVKVKSRKADLFFPIDNDSLIVFNLFN